MGSFVIQDASGEGSLEFFERTPTDPDRPIERFLVRLKVCGLSADARIYADTHPAPLFAQMAANWRGWQGAFAWESLEGEIRLRCSQDRAGHVAIRVDLRSGPTPGDWAILATIMAEAGQLEDMARRAASFFGRDA